MFEPTVPSGPPMSLVVNVVQPTLVNDFTPAFQQIEVGLQLALHQHGLPHDIFNPVPQRQTVFKNAAEVLELLPMDVRQHARYLSKFLGAVGVGLFDAAIVYLWDETVSRLRDRVIHYDLDYFYDIAVDASHRANYKDEKDLNKLSDEDLIQGAHKLDFISDVGLHQLQEVKWLRNHASAAHPNNADLTAFNLLNCLEQCIKEVIAVPLSDVVVEIGRILKIVKTQVINKASATTICTFFVELHKHQAHRMLQGFFGIYVSASTTQQARDNIHLLLPSIWGVVDDHSKRTLGTKVAQFALNNEQDKQQLGQQFFGLVEGLSYLPDNLLVAPIEIALESLRRAHRNLDNFHNEPGKARALWQLVSNLSAIPKGARKLYALVVTDAYLTNAVSNAWNADRYYILLISKFDEHQATLSLTIFLQPDVSYKFSRPVCCSRYVELLQLLEPKFVNQTLKELYAAVKVFSGPKTQMAVDTNIGNRIKALHGYLAGD